GAGGHLDRGLALAVAGVGDQAGSVHDAAQGRHRHRHRHRDQQVQVVAFEQLMGLHRQEDIEVAARPAALSRLALARQADARTVVDARRNLEAELAGLADLAVAPAGGAGVGDHLARAAAAGAGALDLEEAVGLTHAPGAAAGGADGRLGARLGARAVADLTAHQGRDGDLDLGALIGLLKRDLQVVAQVRAAARPVVLASAAAPAAEGVPEGVAEDLGEDVVDVVEARAALAERVAPARAAAVHPGMAETIIGRALLLVGQDGVGLGNLLEAGHGLFRAAVAVRVVLHRQLAIGALERGRIDRPLDPQNLVIVTLRHQAFVLLLSRRFRPLLIGGAPFADDRQPA